MAIIGVKPSALDTTTIGAFQTVLEIDKVLPVTENAITALVGVLKKGGLRFIHEYPGTASGTTVFDLAGHNLFIGKESGNFTLTGHANVCIGDKTGQSLSGDASLNTFVGNFAGKSNTTAHANTFIGRSAGECNTTGGYSVAVGESSFEKNLIGNYNTGCGVNSGMYNFGSNNIAIGLNSLFGDSVNVGASIGSSNVAIGISSLLCVTTGSFNIGIGSSALGTLTTFGYNIAIGINANASARGGNNNIAIGRSALYACDLGQDNIAIGYLTMISNVNGNYNIAIGDGAGSSCLGTGNIFIGYNAGHLYAGDYRLYISFGDVDIIMGDFVTKVVTIYDAIKLNPRADPPSVPEEGQIYADTDHHLYYYNSATWKQLDN